MKKIITACLMALSLGACATSMTIDGTKYRPYGLLNNNERSDKIQYRPAWGNIALGGVLLQTIIAPVYAFGFAFMEPVGPKTTTTPVTK